MPEQHKVVFATSAAKEFRALPIQLKQQVGAAVDGLASNPRPAGVRKLEGGTDLYRVRVGQYRVVYEIDDEALIVRITRVRHRRDVYR
jgi:mRNA interferase RelE/StbE